jgi:transposase
MEDATTFVGIDAHARELQIAVLIGDAAQPTHWRCPTEKRAIERLRRKLEREAPAAIECCYEAGPTGYALQRCLDRDRIRCRVIAPSLVPRRPGDHVKTNRRDAAQLAQLLRAGVLTEVQPPTVADEAVRDLCRARDRVRSDLMRSRHRLSKLLLRRGLLFDGRNWTRPHREWLQRLAWAHPAEQFVVDEYQLAIDHLQTRLREFDRMLAQVADTAPYARAVATLRCFRGIDTITALTLVAELHTFERFPHPRALMAYVGLVPREWSTGDHRRLGSITKAGNGLVRRLLVETAWQYRQGSHIGRAVSRRRVGQPPAIVAIALKAEHRLSLRYRRLSARLKPKPMIAIAVARELVGFLWAALQMREAAVSA